MVYLVLSSIYGNGCSSEGPLLERAILSLPEAIALPALLLGRSGYVSVYQSTLFLLENVLDKWLESCDRVYLGSLAGAANQMYHHLISYDFPTVVAQRWSSIIMAF